MDGVVFLINAVGPAESGFSFMLSERFIPQGLGKVQADVCRRLQLCTAEWWWVWDQRGQKRNRTFIVYSLHSWFDLLNLWISSVCYRQTERVQHKVWLGSGTAQSCCYKWYSSFLLGLHTSLFSRLFAASAFSPRLARVFGLPDYQRRATARCCCCPKITSGSYIEEVKSKGS